MRMSDKPLVDTTEAARPAEPQPTGREPLQDAKWETYALARARGLSHDLAIRATGSGNGGHKHYAEWKARGGSPEVLARIADIVALTSWGGGFDPVSQRLAFLAREAASTTPVTAQAVAVAGRLVQAALKTRDAALAVAPAPASLQPEPDPVWPGPDPMAGFDWRAELQKL